MPCFKLPKLAGEKLEEKFKIRRASDRTSFFAAVSAVDFGQRGGKNPTPTTQLVLHKHLTEMDGVSTFTVGKNDSKNNLNATGLHSVPLSL